MQPAPKPTPEHWMNVRKQKEEAESEMEIFDDLSPRMRQFLASCGGKSVQILELEMRGITEEQIIYAVKALMKQMEQK